MAGQGRLTGFSAVFTVRDVAASLAFYVDRLGFSVQFRMGEPPTYAIVERETISLHLMPASQDPAGLGTSSIYVYVDDADAVHAGLVAMGCPIEIAPEDFSYGMRETSVRDPDGNRITFGAEVRPPSGPS
ncbi:MAG: VOC family protein [Phreatobacter sp.]|nr:VOC family protein [Phreatobacter sp.]